MVAATRQHAFNYENIAEFYAHQDRDVQELMEQSALVIVDYNKAIENGYIKLTKALMPSGERQCCRMILPLSFQRTAAMIAIHREQSSEVWIHWADLLALR